MHLELTDEERAFRDQVRAFIAANLTPELQAAGRGATSIFVDPAYSLPWQRILHGRGWAAPAWPRAHGGPGWSEMQRHIFAAECARAGAPPLAPMGLRMIGPILMHYGSDEQKAHYLPRILSGEDYWCQGFSEPGAGSDLAGLSLRAESDGDDYVLNGSKIWTTHAHFANRMFCLVRTSREGKPQAGITFLLLDMKSPGIAVDPIISLAGEHELNQVFFTDVRVPKANRLGAENDGWSVAKSLLAFERGGGAGPGLQAYLARLREIAARPPGADWTLAQRLARAEIMVEAVNMSEHRLLSALAEGRSPGPASSLLKTRSTETMQHLDELAVDLVGAAACRWPAEPDGANAPEPQRDEAQWLTARYLNNRAASIYGGSNEVQRNIIARMMLGL
ncbi:acyl-CoA dehydrogenase family protein [Marinibaculum pumilum]|uniref:Acyl-CoA dehydrogenase family protein n=1 Tax=Marinibaculum pumilum TaxID=1766165 RepID=A0ABV7L370_9PROT